MRELKFRMFALDVQKMFEMDRLHLPCTTKPNPASVYMQYTGLKDSKGQEIYEGDIVQYKQRNLEKAFGINEGGDDFEVKTRKIMYLYQSFNVPGGFIKDLEVIGNIYEK
jgi:hypothetical protein